MGMIGDIYGILFGGSRNVLRDTIEVFRENSESSAQRAADLQSATAAQFAAEFAHERRGIFDRLIDGLNRIPRPAMALGTLGLIAAAMIDPIWFASRMQGVALIPEPLWWLFGAIVSFYFGARHQQKGQQFERDVAKSMMLVPKVLENVNALNAHKAAQNVPAPVSAMVLPPKTKRIKSAYPNNAALTDWAALHATM